MTAHPSKVVPVEPDAGLMSVIASMVRRIAVPVSVDPDAIYFDNGHARQIYQAIIEAASPVQSAPQGGGEAVIVWTQKGAGVDGDPLRAVTRFGDMTAEVLLSRGSGGWNARGSHIDGKLGFATQGEAREFAETSLRDCANRRIAGSKATLKAFDPAALATPFGDVLGGALRSEIYAMFQDRGEDVREINPDDEDRSLEEHLLIRAYRLAALPPLPNEEVK